MDVIERMDPFKNKNDLMYPEHMARYMFASQFANNRNVIDCSCGNGYGSYYLATHGAANVLGIDIAQEAIDYSKEHFQHNNLKYVLGDATNLMEIEDGTVDVYVCYETIEHIAEPSLMLREIKRILKPDGILLISCPNDNIFEPNNPYHCEVYTLEKFRSLISGFFGNSHLFTQNNMTGTSILPFDIVENADADRDGIETLAYPVSARSSENADTWLLVCSDHEITIPVQPVTSFFTTYSQYILEVQAVNNSLYEENRKFSQAWETQRDLIHRLEAENQKLASAWETNTSQIKLLEAENQKLANAWEIHSNQINRLEKENEKLAESWDKHTEYIKRIEEENKKLAEAWNEHTKYINELEERIAKNRTE